MGAQLPMQRGAPHTQENTHLQSIRQCLSIFKGGATGSIDTYIPTCPTCSHAHPLALSLVTQWGEKSKNIHTWIQGFAICATVIARDRANKVL